MRAVKKIISTAQAEIEPVLKSPGISSLELNSLAEDIQTAHDSFVAALNHDNKDYIRAIHLHAKQSNPGFKPDLIRKLFEKHARFFKSGDEITPSKIQPKLYLAEGTLWEELFAVTRACWSMPYNKGYGRRLRFVVFDEYHESVIGVIGLQSPPADLKSRDDLFSYPANAKLDLINNTLDAYAVGAIPPYSFLLGGKLCAGMISTDTVRRMYWRKYVSQKSIMRETMIQQSLVAVTTTSAFGRSSIYNRLKFNSRTLAEPIGYTQGFGTIHLEHLYSRIVDVLKSCGKFTPAGFGNGPKVRWQNITKGLISLGISPQLLQHGLKRQVFMFRLVDQLEQGMSGKNYGAPICLEEDVFGEYWKDRWADERARRYPEWSTINATELIRKKLLEC